MELSHGTWFLIYFYCVDYISACDSSGTGYFEVITYIHVMRMGFLGISAVVLVTAIAVKVIPWLFRKRAPVHVSGFTAPGWELVEQAFRENIESELDGGGGFAVYHKGELVVDLSGGYADYEARWPWNKDTLTCVYSSTKGLAALMVAMLVDRGLLEYDQPVSRYWPEFGQNGKDKITVRQLMSHRAGVPVLDENFKLTEIADNPEKITRLLERQKPIWEPGTQHGYHAITIGLYADNLIKRVDPKHRDVQQFFTEEIKEPFGIDFFIGLPPEHHHRCARLNPMDPLQIFNPKTVDWHVFLLMLRMFTQPGSLIGKAMNNVQEFNLLNPKAKTVACSSFLGFGSAHGLAKIYSILANGGTFGEQRLLSEKVIKNMISQPNTGHDMVVNKNLTWVAGMKRGESPAGDAMYGSSGAGGQMGYADLENNLALAYVTSDLKPAPLGRDPRYLRLEKAVYEALEKVKKSK